MQTNVPYVISRVCLALVNDSILIEQHLVEKAFCTSLLNILLSSKWKDYNFRNLLLFVKTVYGSSKLYQ